MDITKPPDPAARGRVGEIVDYWFRQPFENRSAIQLIAALESNLRDEVAAARAETLAQAADIITKWKFMACSDADGLRDEILSISPDPNYRKRVETLAALETATVCANMVDRGDERLIGPYIEAKKRSLKGLERADDSRK